jgi:hypothetical protein
MAVQRENDEERAAIVERLVEENRRPHRRQVQVSTGEPNGAERSQRPERRKFRSDAELRRQREELEREWNEKHRRRKRRKAS